MTEDHPDVQALVEEAMKEAAESPISASRELYLEALEKHIREVDSCAATLSFHTYIKQHYLCLRNACGLLD